jgi:hypothetical protein
MKKINFIFIILIIGFYSCKKKEEDIEVPEAPSIDAKVTQYSCTNSYYYSINLSSGSSAEIDFGDGSSILTLLSSKSGYHQYTSIGNFIFKIKQTFSDGQVVEKTFPINITQLSKSKLMLSTNIPRTDFGTQSKIESFEFGGNVYFNYQNQNNSAYRYVYNKASNSFFKTWNSGNAVSHIYDGTYVYKIGTGVINKFTFDSITNAGFVASLPFGLPIRYDNLETVANGKLYYGFGGTSGAIYDSKLYAIDCTTGATTLIPTPYASNAQIIVGGQAFYNNKIYIFSSVGIIIFDPVTEAFTSAPLNIPAFMIGPGRSNKTKVINNYAFMQNANTSEVVVYDFTSNTFLNNCELKNMKGINFVANNKFYTLNPIYNPFAAGDAELWEYQP